MIGRHTRIITIGATIAILVSLARAQTLSSSNHVLVSSSSAHGGTAATSTYELVGAFGRSPLADRMSTLTYALEGGFVSTIDVDPTGTPWITAVSPRFGTLRGQESLTIFGTAFDLGSNPTIRIGGRTAVLGARVRDRITTLLPIQPAPGWLPVEVTNNLGTTVLTRGIGILPLIESEPAPASDVPISLVFRGTQGDFVYWALGFGPSTPIPLPGIHYGLALNPSAFVVLAGVGIASSNGELRLSFPATTYATGTVYAQALFSTSNPGYAPASFSNWIRL